MQRYIGTKIINAKPMNRQKYNDFRGWQLPADECGDDKGYLVESVGEPANTEEFAGYVSWSPSKQFEEVYRKTTGIPFGLAVEAMKYGKKVSREGWNGKGVFVILVFPGDVYVKPYSGYSNLSMQRYIEMKTAQDEIVPWVASHSDILADDWIILD